MQCQTGVRSRDGDEEVLDGGRVEDGGAQPSGDGSLALEEGLQLLSSSLEHMISMVYVTIHRWNQKVQPSMHYGFCPLEKLTFKDLAKYFFEKQMLRFLPHLCF